jgi:hypothetical protein
MQKTQGIQSQLRIYFTRFDEFNGKIASIPSPIGEKIRDMALI